jgi:uncharacterized protein
VGVVVAQCSSGHPSPRRLRSLPLANVAGRAYPVAATLRSRLLGLAFLDCERANPGLLIPRCRSVHTFGMRFGLDVIFLAEDWTVIEAVLAVPPRRLVGRPGAAAVLEVPAAGGWL